MAVTGQYEKSSGYSDPICKHCGEYRGNHSKSDLFCPARVAEPPTAQPAAVDEATPRPWRATAVRHNRGGEQYIEIERPTGPKSATMICSISSIYLNVDELTDEDRANAELIIRSVNAAAGMEALEKAAKSALAGFRYLRDKDTQAWDLNVTPEICNAWDDLRAALAAVEQLKGKTNAQS